MRVMRGATSLLALSLVACRGNVGDFPGGPGETTDPLACEVRPELLPTPVEPGDERPLTVGPDTPLCTFADDEEFCLCDDYEGMIPDGMIPALGGMVTNPFETSVADEAAYLAFLRDAGAEFIPDSLPRAGCRPSAVAFAWPACSHLAEVSGRLPWEPNRDHFGGGIGGSDDEDIPFHLCPHPESMAVQPSVPLSHELRNQEDFTRQGARPIGRMHIEQQDCRFYDGTFEVAVLDDIATPTGVTRVHSSRPGMGDEISVAGEWVFDPGHTGWSEIHEARIQAVVRPDHGEVGTRSNHYYAFVNGFFAPDSGQANLLALDVRIPPPADDPVVFGNLECVLEPLGGSLVSALDLVCHGDGVGEGVVRAVVPSRLGDGYCRVEVERTSDEAPGADAYECSKRCNGNRFSEVDDLERRCEQVSMHGVMRASWRDPGDYWVCHSCGCADLASPGSTVAAPVIGCVTEDVRELLADPATRPFAEQQACAQICPGAQMCGASRACALGECVEPVAGSAVAELLAESVCDPLVPSPVLHMAQAGDYHVTLASSTNVDVSIGSSTYTRPVQGELYVNLDSAAEVADFASTSFTTPDTEIRHIDVEDVRFVSGARLIGPLVGAGVFFPSGHVELAARAVIDGQRRGFNTRNPDPITGTVDVDARTFSVPFVAIDPGEADRAISGELVGVIDNVPPVAVPSRTPSTVECTSPATTPVVLDGTASFDPDPGDALVLYQWFDAVLGRGLGSSPILTTELPLGLSRVRLHVYDVKLGANAASREIEVVDTTPPVLELATTELCMWPPNHPRVRFDLDELEPSATDLCDSTPTIRIASVVSDEPDDGTGDGSTTGDVSFSANTFCERVLRGGVSRARSRTGRLVPLPSRGRRRSSPVRALDSVRRALGRERLLRLLGSLLRRSRAGTRVPRHSFAVRRGAHRRSAFGVPRHD